MLDEFLREINELIKYRDMYENQKKDKKVMSEMLFKLMTEKYDNTPYEQRVSEYKQDMCRDCRYVYSCEIKLPEDIRKPISSDEEWIPKRKACGQFAWS